MRSFSDNNNKIICADVFEGLSQIEDESVDLIFIDPPYNIGKKFESTMDKWDSDEDYLNWCYKWIDECICKLKKTGSMYIMTSTQFMPYFDIYIRSKMTILSRIIWSYDSSGVEAKTGAQRKLIDYRKPVPTPYNTEKVPGNVWNFPRVRYRMDEYENHPTQKPIALLERIIKASSNEGDLILDPFSGTFTTSYVANSLGRKSIGIDISEEYFKIGLRRVLRKTEYNGESITREPKSYERKNIQQGQEVLPLFA